MSRKDYVMLAASIRRINSMKVFKLGGPTTQQAIRELVVLLADELKHDNERFDRDRFINAALQD